MQHVPPLAAAVNPPGPGAGPIASGDSCSDQVTWGLRQQAGQAAGSLPPVAQRSGTTAVNAATTSVVNKEWTRTFLSAVRINCRLLTFLSFKK